MSDDFIFTGLPPSWINGLIAPLPGSDWSTVLQGFTLYRTESTEIDIWGDGTTATVETTTGTDGSSESHVQVNLPSGDRSDVVRFDEWINLIEEFRRPMPLNDNSNYWISFSDF